MQVYMHDLLKNRLFGIFVVLTSYRQMVGCFRPNAQW
jgi:hypothetical protein